MSYNLTKGLPSEVLQEYECVVMDPHSERDDFGNLITRWEEGAHFVATFSKQGESFQQIAQQLGARAEYTIITERNFILDDLKIIKRLSDGMIFRVKSDGIDAATPPSSSLNMRSVKAEEWKI